MNNKQELTIEECKAIFFDKEALVEPTYQLYRLNNGAGRIYYDFDITGIPKFYTSVTEMIKKTLPTSPYLIKWIADMGYERAKAFAKERAQYGTAMHMMFQKLLIERQIDLDEFVPDFLLGYMIQEKCPMKFYDEWLYELRKDILSFGAFMIEHNVQPLAIEVMLKHDKYKIAGAIDLFCLLDLKVKGMYNRYKANDKKGNYKKGDPKEGVRMIRTLAVIDFKSGKKGFYQENEIQLESYRQMVKLNFPEYTKNKSVKILNFAPNDWQSEPTFRLKDQSDSKNLKKLPLLIKENSIETGKREPNIMIVGGNLDMSKGAEGLEENFEHISLERFVTVKQQKDAKRPDSKEKRSGSRKQTTNTR